MLKKIFYRFKLKKELEIINSKLNVKSYNPKDLSCKVLILIKMKRYHEAIDAIDLLLGKEYNVGNLRIKANIYKYMRKDEKAISVLKEILKLEPTNNSVKLEIAAIEEENKTGRLEKLKSRVREYDILIVKIILMLLFACTLAIVQIKAGH